MMTIDPDTQAIRSRLTPKQPDDAAVLEHLQNEAEVEPEPEENNALTKPSQSPGVRLYNLFMWLDRTFLVWMDTRSGQYVAYIFLGGILIWSMSQMVPSEQRTNAALRQVYEYCKD